jgi:type IV secretion system protein VirB1
MNFAGFGVNAHTIFDPCINLSIGASILGDDYAFAARRYRDAQVALRHAIGMYNTGRLNAGTRYIARVVAAAEVRDGYVQSSRVATTRGAMHSPLLVRAPITRRARAMHREQVTPARSPILVSNVSHVVVF